MGFLKAARDGLSGDTKHWSRTHNAVLGELIEKVKALPSERVDFFTRLLVVCHFTVERLVFPKEGKSLIEVSLKSITRSQFLELYAVLLAFLVAKLAKASPQITSSIQTDLLQLVDSRQTELAEQVFQDITKAPTNDTESIRLWKFVTGIFDNNVGNEIQNLFILYASLIEQVRVALQK